MGTAALQYARRGWAVFPCRERTTSSTNGAGETREFKAKAPYVGQWRKDATTDERRIEAWWRQYPDALIGLPMGVNGCFALDFDPRTDPATGEVFTLERLKAELETQLGCELPPSLTAITQSDGVHVYFRQPAGEPIRNRGNLPAHVDVRGLGGYVIAPPSTMVDTGARYRWHRGDWRDDAAIATAPAELIAILRAPKARPTSAERLAPAATASLVGVEQSVDEDIRKYALAALAGECRTIRSAPHGNHNPQFNISSLKIASLVAAGALDEGIARSSIEAACLANPGSDDERAVLATVASGWTAGLASPRDLGEIAAASRSRRERRQNGRGPPASSRPRPPQSDDDGTPCSHEGGWGSDIGGGGGQGGAGNDLTRECAFLPHTDLGNLQRFLKRFGGDFLYVEQWGWLAWDGRRWNRDMATAMLGRAVQDTMRAIQAEAALVAASGVPFPPEGGFPTDDDPETRTDDDDLFAKSKSGEARRKRKTISWMLQRQEARKCDNAGDRFDYIAQVKSNGDLVLFSDKIVQWGRTSEGAGHIACIAKMAEARLSARPDDFDADPLRINILNGTLVFARPEDGKPARFRLVRHNPADRMTKVAEVAHDPAATCPLYEAFIDRVQPDADMRDFLDTWAGYNMLGEVSAQKFALFYGEGSNGKSVWMDVKAHILGDYSWVTGIETFIDQGKYRKGSDASPDLAAMAGRRMVRSSEPEEGSKFSDGLIKALTGSEPIPVRELMKPPFNMRPTFKATVAANNKPKIGTDHGIQRRMMLVPWDVIIPDDEVDLLLVDKLKGEASGILNRMIAGALRYLTSGLALPEAVREATREYQDENDVLGQFLALVIERAEGETIGASALHKLFAAWQTWANLLPATGKPWSPKYLNAQMTKKRFRIKKSSTMLWQDIRALFGEGDFVDHEGRAVTAPLPPPSRFLASERAPPVIDDDDVPL